MIRPGRKPGFLSALLLVVFLHTAQYASLLHAFEHEPDALSGKACSTCVAVSQLASACVDTQCSDESLAGHGELPVLSESGFLSAYPVLVHQRGPPATL